MENYYNVYVTPQGIALGAPHVSAYIARQWRVGEAKCIGVVGPKKDRSNG